MFKKWTNNTYPKGIKKQPNKVLKVGNIVKFSQQL